ncbi:MAG TPA: cytochrome C oxidase subunit I [Noviherbaspirillum sp.]
MERSKQQEYGRWKLFAVLAICAAPVIASYFTYYVIKPQSRTNYGALIDPRAYPIPATLGTVTFDGKPVSLEAYKGKWIMLTVDGADCADVCRKKLYYMRQLRLAQGKDMERIERVWLVTDDKPVETLLMREYDGMHMLRAKADAITAWLPVDSGTVASDHIYMIDPLGNLMMRFPKDADPNKIKKDIVKLLKASRIG